ncbi:MAG TPA: LLM class flavin-dependent oxidoreductase [Thermomicrobiales bacterium]|nr:LLM class flavin-dependent oxidoreductase [Thermomicrobiales bacterium]
MAHPQIEVGMYVVAKAPLGGVEALVGAAQGQQYDSVFIWDHLQDFFPSAIWDEDFAWFAAESASPHEWFEFQTLLGYLAAKFPGVRLGIGVTEPFRRHPAILAQAALTLAHLSQRPPILGLGAGERLGTEPYGLDFSRTVGRLEEALQIIRRCLDARGPFDFEGEHFRLRGAVVDVPVPDGRKPEVWVAAHGPRMLRLTGQYGDGWYPVFVASPEDYAGRLEVIRAAARDAGRDPDAITPAMHPVVVVAPTEEEARAMLDTKPIRFFGLLLPDAIWQLFGLRHPLGEDFRGYLDILPETYDRQTVEAAIAAVPRGMMEGLLWGTPEQVVAKVRAFGEAGLRHVVPLVASAAVSPEAAGYSMEAMAGVAQALRSGE